MNPVKANFDAVLAHIQTACAESGRAAHAVQLLAVSKTQPAERLVELYDLGQHAFGENYLQEALAKIHSLQHLNIEWHFIGHVQRNKTKPLAEKFAWVHGVDRLIIAERLSQQRSPTLPPLNICLQVNIDAQDSKDGCAVTEVADLVAQISALPNVRLRGLMVIPAAGNIAALSDAAQLFQTVKAQHHQPQDWDTLSMGMSGDLSEAIAAGSTMLRIGTALFGVRDRD